MRKHRILTGALLAVAAVAACGAAAQDWPQRPVTMVIPFGAGSGIDVLGRVLAPAMAARLGQPIVVENVGGAGGMTGTARVAKALPDGNVFVLGNVGTRTRRTSRFTRIRSTMPLTISRRSRCSPTRRRC